MTLYIIAAIVISIALGYKTKINIGLFAIVFFIPNRLLWYAN